MDQNVGPQYFSCERDVVWRVGSEHCALSRDFRRFVSMCLSIDALLCVGCVFSKIPLGVGRQALHHPSQRLRQRRPRVLRRKRDCTPALFLTLLRWPSTSSPGTLEEDGLAPSPFLLTMLVTTSEEKGQGLLLTTSACTSEEEGQAFLLAP